MRGGEVRYCNGVFFALGWIGFVAGVRYVRYGRGD